MGDRTMTEKPDGFEMLKREHRFVEELLGRLQELAERMRSGERVAPGTVRLGVGLLDAYLHRIHMRQFDHELWPIARGVTRPECGGTLAQIRGDHERLRGSAQEILELTSRWAMGDAGAEAEVAQRLAALVAFDGAINTLEERQPFTCLPTALPAGERERLGAAFAGHTGAKGAVEARISRYLRLSEFTPNA